MNDWPPVEGRYKIGDKTSPVAVCTNASIDEIDIDLKKISIIGKCVTENIGIEKIIQNVVSNNNIRYLVLCGKKSKGHFISQAIECLKKNGIDKDKKIIGAIGNMPYLRNINEKLIERFRQQVEIINMAGESDSQKIEAVIDKLLQGKTQIFEGEAVKIEKIQEIEAKSGQWVADPKGYFVISLNKERTKIIADHFVNGKINKRIVGKNAKEICDTIASLNLIGEFEQSLEHSMYLGRELLKAEIALRENLDFEQDKSLIIKKDKKQQESTNEYGWFD